MAMDDPTLRRHLASGRYQTFLGIELVSADPEQQSLVMKIPFKPDFEREPDSRQWHGGVIATFIDIAGDFALMQLLGRGIPTINLRIDYLRPAVGTDLHAMAHVVKAGRSIGVVDVTVRDDGGRPIAIGRGAYSTQ